MLLISNFMKTVFIVSRIENQGLPLSQKILVCQLSGLSNNMMWYNSDTPLSSLVFVIFVEMFHLQT